MPNSSIMMKERLKHWVQFRDKSTCNQLTTTRLWVRLDLNKMEINLVWTIQTQVVLWLCTMVLVSKNFNRCSKLYSIKVQAVTVAVYCFNISRTNNMYYYLKAQTKYFLILKHLIKCRASTSIIRIKTTLLIIPSAWSNLYWAPRKMWEKIRIRHNLEILT